MLCYGVQMVCNYHGRELVPFNLRQWKGDTQTCKIIIHGPSVQTKSMTIRICLLDPLNL